ncbi:MAG TPA: hypothetical protein VG206_14260, partial [Terriglobia bacterium]|nr:hypothetical protein [Terriglobia bacterium]
DGNTKPDFVDTKLLPTKNGLDFGVHLQELSLADALQRVLANKDRSDQQQVASHELRILLNL